MLNGVGAVSGTGVAVDSGRAGPGVQDLVQLLAGLRDILGLDPLTGAGLPGYCGLWRWPEAR